MDTGLATQLITMRTAATQQSVQLAVFKKTHEMETNLLETLMQTATSAAPPPPGQGLRVDKFA